MTFWVLYESKSVQSIKNNYQHTDTYGVFRFLRCLLEMGQLWVWPTLRHANGRLVGLADYCRRSSNQMKEDKVQFTQISRTLLQ